MLLETFHLSASKLINLIKDRFVSVSTIEVLFNKCTYVAGLFVILREHLLNNVYVI